MLKDEKNLDVFTESIRDDWNSHWDNYAESAQSNPAQSYRRHLIFSALGLSRQKGPFRILDIGSGQGDFALDVERTYPNAEILGIELSKSGVSISQKKVQRASFLEQDLLEFRVPPKSFEQWAQFAVCSEVLEHIEEPGRILANIRPYLAPNAKIVITVPGGPMSAFDRHIGHRKHYRVEELRYLVEQNGYCVERVEGAGFPFFNIYKLVVIARGKKLIEEVASSTQNQKLSLMARVVMAFFGILFRLNSNRSRFGWQMICVARKTD